MKSTVLENPVQTALTTNEAPGIVRSAPRTGCGQLKSERRAQLHAAVKAGKTVKECCAEFGISDVTYYYTRKRLGMPSLKASPPPKSSETQKPKEKKSLPAEPPGRASRQSLPAEPLEALVNSEDVIVLFSLPDHVQAAIRSLVLYKHLKKEDIPA